MFACTVSNSPAVCDVCQLSYMRLTPLIGTSGTTQETNVKHPWQFLIKSACNDIARAGVLRCRKDIVGVAHKLHHLDGTPVLKQERLFLQRLHSRKLSRDVSFKAASADSVQPTRHLLVPCLPCTCIAYTMKVTCKPKC